MKLMFLPSQPHSAVAQPPLPWVMHQLPLVVLAHRQRLKKHLLQLWMRDFKLSGQKNDD